MKVKTGLFVNWEKGKLLISIVLDLLKQRYGTSVVRGNRQPNNLCELILLPLRSSGFDIAQSKELLVHYLDMIGESQQNRSVKEGPEVINLDDEEIACIDLVESSVSIIDLDNFESTINRSTNEDVVIESEKCEKTSAKGNTLWTEFKENISKESEIKRRKRKYPFTEEKEDSIEVVNLIDDSFSNTTFNSPSKSYSDVTATILGDKKKVMADSSCRGPSHINMHNSGQLNASTNCSNKSETVTIVNLVEDEDESQNSVDKESSSNPAMSAPPKKISKFAYKRPAHLNTPLIRDEGNNTLLNIVANNPPSNIYNPNTDTTLKRTGLRPIVIDGNNVAISHGRGNFSLRGIQICVNYFERRGHRQIKVFIPQYRRNRETHDVIHQLERKGIVAITPSRRVDGKVVASYDDRYIVQYAAEFGGVIVSTDNFRDLLLENKQWKDTIQNRLLMFTWVDDLLMFPQDPLGRRGPSLDEFLRFPK